MKTGYLTVATLDSMKIKVITYLCLNIFVLCEGRKKVVMVVF
jgi:hypothetical protein